MSRIHNTGYSNLKSCKINIGLLSLACTYQISSPVYSRVFHQEGKEVGTVQHIIDIVVDRHVTYTFLIYPSSGQLRGTTILPGTKILTWCSCPRWTGSRPSWWWSPWWEIHSWPAQQWRTLRPTAWPPQSSCARPAFGHNHQKKRIPSAWRKRVLGFGCADASKNAVFRIRTRIGSGFNQVSGSVSRSEFGIRLWIQEGKNDLQK